MRIFAPVFIILYLVIIGCSEPNPDYPQRQMPVDIEQDQAELSWAKATFLSKCAYCHGHENEGRGERADFFEPPAPDFSERKYREIDGGYLFWRIAEGKSVEPFRSRGSVMPAWGVHFSDRQIWGLVVYIKQRSGSETSGK